MRSSSAATSSGRRTRGSVARALGRGQQVGGVLRDARRARAARGRSARSAASLRATVRGDARAVRQRRGVAAQRPRRRPSAGSRPCARRPQRELADVDRRRRAACARPRRGGAGRRRTARSASRQAARRLGGLSSAAVAVFFIDTVHGSGRHPAPARSRPGSPGADEPPPRPWHRIQGTSDASTMWYAVMRRQERGMFIGALVLRHGDHHAFLLERGWEEVPVEEIGVPARGRRARRRRAGRHGPRPV